MKKINAQSLDTVCTIARLGTFQAAAEQLHTTQPAVSARVRELESALGIPLFEKHGRRMVLTSGGRELVQNVEPLLFQLEDVLVALENPESTTGVVRIGVGEMAALTWFPSMIAKLKTLMPRVRYQIDVGLTVTLRQRLEGGEIDLAIIAAPVVLHQIDSAPLGEVSMRWMTSPRHIAPAGSRTRASSRKQRDEAVDLLRTQPLWTIAKPSTIYPMAVDALKSLGVPATQLHTCDNNLCLMRILAAGGGIGLVPDVLADDFMKRGELVPLSTALPEPKLAFAIAWSREREQSMLRRVVDAAVAASDFPRAATKA